jgi:hypothetical protein
VIGTKYVNYASIDVGITHSWLFTWYCLLLYHTDLFFKNPNLKRSARSGLTSGKENKILRNRLFYNDPTKRIYIDAHRNADQYESIQVFFRNTGQAQGSFFIRNLLVEGFK